MIAASFGFTQIQASKWCKALRPLLFDVLSDLKMTPTREGHKVAQILENLGKKSTSKRLLKDLLIDL
jgi:hypothetical protein